MHDWTVIISMKNTSFDVPDDSEEISTCPSHAVPIRADIRTFAFDSLISSQIHHAGRLFDVVLMDPPWSLTSTKPSRGVSLGYSQMSQADIRKIPVQKLQRHGCLFLWVINSKLEVGLELLEHWGYKYAQRA